MKEDEIVNWIDNYRKWRQWNRQHKALSKQHDLLEDDLTSPYCSPLHAVVAFAKASKIPSPEPLRKVLLNQQLRAGFRVAGLSCQEKLLRSLWNSPYQRLILSNLSQTLQESTFNQVETCGVTLAQSINEGARLLVRALMSFVIQSRSQIEKLIYKRSLVQY